MTILKNLLKKSLNEKNLKAIGQLYADIIMFSDTLKSII